MISGHVRSFLPRIGIPALFPRCGLSQAVEGDAALRSRSEAFCDYVGSIWQFVDTVVREALARDMPTVEACNAWFSGAYLLETVPGVLYVLARHAHQAEEAIVRAVNDTWDNDTAAAIVGAAVGALHGAEALPRRWRDGLLGRTGAEDDGRVFELLAAARRRWV